MTATKLSLSDYLTLEDDFAGRREFVDGEMVEMPPESPQNLLISLFLLTQLLQQVPLRQLRRMDTELVVAGRVRIPDLLVLGAELAEILLASGRSTITTEMPAPVLVVEVVSPGKLNQDRDYRFKRSEYAARGIPEYWIVDPEQRTVTVLGLIDGWYEPITYRGQAQIASAVFPQLQLTVEQLWQAGGD